MQFEIERRYLYINNLTAIIKNIVENWNLYNMHKFTKFIKPQNIQILSKYPLEKVIADISYFNNKFDLEEIKNKYLFIRL